MRIVLDSTEVIMQAWKGCKVSASLFELPLDEQLLANMVDECGHWHSKRRKGTDGLVCRLVVFNCVHAVNGNMERLYIYTNAFNGIYL